ncbi:hypothetical protein NHX12_024376 [Muraenolepis orangiensis]|uniref:Uncharacterized protein n=1 Tax=Muraenolepis orangiensis TaxID=630683 RepID=A0A9Q0EHC9_9TELE|nr:hypothetical protein NHX12_024376 [Muraenolepis orangiensis]
MPGSESFLNRKYVEPPLPNVPVPSNPSGRFLASPWTLQVQPKDPLPPASQHHAWRALWHSETTRPREKHFVLYGVRWVLPPPPPPHFQWASKEEMNLLAEGFLLDVVVVELGTGEESGQLRAPRYSPPVNRSEVRVLRRSGSVPA